MKKIASQVKTVKSDFSDMAVEHVKQSISGATVSQAVGSEDGGTYRKNFVVDDLETGTLLRKTAVHLGLLLDDGVDFAAHLNPLRRLKGSKRSTAELRSRQDKEHHEIRYRQKINIEAHDGIQLCANLFAPDTGDPQQCFPAIVFINSWCMDKHQYLLQARRFARNGYIVLSYSARGWGQSGGVVNVGGGDDMRDISAVIDWLEANTPVEPENIGFSGISYGSGLSLLGTAHDKRIKTAVCMSGWTDLYEAFFSQQTPREFFARVLVDSSKVMAKTDDSLKYVLSSLLQHENMEEVQAWARERSAANYLAKYNRRKPPLYFVQNYQDELFQPNSVLDFFRRYKGPKRIDLSNGTHGSAELSGILGLKNHLWLQTHAWFNHWLKGVPNQIMAESPISCQFERKTRLHLSLGRHEGHRHSLQDWVETHAARQTFHLCPPLNSADVGRLGAKPPGDVLKTALHSAPGPSRSTAGIPILSSSRSAHLNMPLKLNLAKIPEKVAVVFQSEPLERSMRVLGTPELSLYLETNRPQMQLIAYLYDLPHEGHGRLITHGPITRHLVKPGEPFQVSFELVTSCYELAAGNRLVLAIDTGDLQYQSPTRDDFRVTLHYTGIARASLDVPLFEVED